MVNGYDYDTIMKEYFDITDTKTRKTLLAVNEADQNKVLTSLTSRLYDHLVTKVDDIDFGDIPNTKGDITKLKNYSDLNDCVDIMTNLLMEFKQDTTPITVIDKAINNIIARKELFEKGFRYKVELPMVLYSTMVLSVISATSFLISTCVEFIKTPNNDTFEMVIDKVALAKSKDNLLFVNLKKFNAACDKKQIDNCLDVVIKNSTKNLLGSNVTLVVGGIALAGLLLNIIPIMRELIFFFYNTRTRMSDYFDVQSDLLKMNAYNLECNETIEQEKRQKIVAKQYKISDRFKKIANFLAIKNKDAENKATKEILGDNKKYKTDELMEELPDSAASVLF